MRWWEIAGHEVESFAACPRQYWFLSRGLRMEPFSELVQDGRLVSETAYPAWPASRKQVRIGRLKIDGLDPHHKRLYEVKRAARLVQAHRMQLLFYLWVLEKLGWEGFQGVLLYPREKKRIEVLLTPEGRVAVTKLLRALVAVRRAKQPPPLQKKPFCKHCAYKDLCWLEEL
ncbi:MAG: CRISPR-associated protein Cas4 [Bacteroidia bacterium]|nr:MAG: CRISPR-associated protein Cas4 [Bacteroidia bacterium]